MATSTKGFTFDGCAICTVTKAADDEGRSPTEAELKTAFKEQNDKQAREKHSHEQGTSFAGGGSDSNGAEKAGDPAA